MKTIIQQETTAYQTSAEHYNQQLMLHIGCKGAEHFMRNAITQSGRNTSDKFFDTALTAFNTFFRNTQTEHENIEKQNNVKFLELLSQCPLSLVNFIEKELETLIDAITNNTEILKSKKNENLAKIDTTLENLLSFFNHITCQYEMAHARESLARYLQEKIIPLKNIETGLRIMIEELETLNTQQSFHP